MHTIVGFTGLKRSGKDSAAGIIVRRYKFQQAAFAMWLKDACRGIFQLSYAQLHGSEEDKETIDPRWNVSSRQIMQVVGTDLFRDALTQSLPGLSLPKGYSLWCYCMKLWIQSLKTPHRIVISDVRFPDEAALIRELGGTVIRIKRDASTSSLDSHQSETAQADIEPDHTVENNGTLYDLDRAVTRIVDNLISQMPRVELKRKAAVRGLVLNLEPTTIGDLEKGTLVEHTSSEKQPSV